MISSGTSQKFQFFGNLLSVPELINLVTFNFNYTDGWQKTKNNWKILNSNFPYVYNVFHIKLQFFNNKKLSKSNFLWFLSTVFNQQKLNFFNKRIISKSYFPPILIKKLLISKNYNFSKTFLISKCGLIIECSSTL